MAEGQLSFTGVPRRSTNEPQIIEHVQEPVPAEKRPTGRSTQLRNQSALLTFLLEELGNSSRADSEIARAFQKINGWRNRDHMKGILWHPLLLYESPDNRWPEFTEELSQLLLVLKDDSTALSLTFSAIVIGENHLVDFKPEMYYRGFTDRQEDIIIENTLRVIIAKAIEHQWNVPQHQIRRALSPGSRTTPTGQVVLPSLEKKLYSHTQDSNLDPMSSEEFRMLIRWPRVAPQYKSDLSIYVWEPHTESPHIEYCRLTVLEENNNLEHRKVLLAVSSKDLLVRLQTIVPTLQEELWKTHCPGEVVVPYLNALVVLLLAVFDIKRDDLKTFLEQGSDQVDQLTYRCRSRPSSGKLNYLLNLSDYTHSCQSACTEELQDLDRLLAVLNKETENIQGPARPPQNSLIAIRDALVDVRTDLKYLRGVSEALSERISKLRKTTTGLLDLAQMRQTYLLTILAGIYIPLSFVATYLGMNLTDNSPNTWALDNVQYNGQEISSMEFVPNSTQVTLPPLASFFAGSNSTVITSDSQNAKMWTQVLYWYVAVPLAFGTILLPLVIGAIVRLTLRIAWAYRDAWVSIVVSFVAVGILCLQSALALASCYATPGPVMFAIDTFLSFLLLIMPLWQWYCAFYPKTRSLECRIFWILLSSVLLVSTPLELWSMGGWGHNGQRCVEHAFWPAWIFTVAVWVTVTIAWKVRSAEYFSPWKGNSNEMEARGGDQTMRGEKMPLVFGAEKYFRKESDASLGFPELSNPPSYRLERTVSPRARGPEEMSETDGIERA